MSRKRIPGIIYLRELVSTRNMNIITNNGEKKKKLFKSEDVFFTNEDIKNHKTDNIYIKNNTDVDTSTYKMVDKKYTYEQELVLPDTRKNTRNTRIIGIIALGGLILLKSKIK